MQDVVYKLVPGLQNSKYIIMCFHDVKLKIQFLGIWLYPIHKDDIYI